MIGRTPLLPLKLVSERPCTDFGHSNQRKRQASIRHRLLSPRSMASNTDMNQQTKTGGSAWLGSGALLALGGALPGLLLAWKWEQIADMGHLYQSLSVLSADAVFILTATAFLSTGSAYGTQSYGVFPKYPGPFKEVDGSTLPPSYFQAYVTSMPLTFGIIIPVVALVYMVWQHDNDLAICTLGAYLVEVVAQLVSEGVYIKQGLILLWVFNFGVVMTWTPWLYRWHLQPEGQENNITKLK